MIFNGLPAKRVNLSKNNLGRVAALAIAEAFEFKDNITHLDLSWNNLYHAPSTKRLLEQMSQSRVLKEVNLAWNALEGENLAMAIRNLLKIPTLTILDLSSNRLAGEAIETIAANLSLAKNLNTLDLSYNPLSPNDVITILQKMLLPRVKLQNLLMANVFVRKQFMVILNRVKNMKSRKDFVVFFGGVLGNWTITGADAREVVLRRADYLCSLSKRNKVDIGLYLLALAKEFPKPIIPVMDLVDRCAYDNIPIDADLIAELAEACPGPKSAKTKLINMDDVCEFVKRLWPERKLPPTPPPEPEPEPIPEPQAEPEPKKGKRKK
ncbi:Uncharacterized protein OBRU01_02358 [Operophtera brumata]|uniref:Uncharacterized protein n=1 Tax=Operophtera brumata TaxID=104452 RepID=A0A0L7LPZ7_OPEBR|nr:Uncharacterized protein OBRU01_02358 [Operophtera brumata]